MVLEKHHPILNTGKRKKSSLISINSSFQDEAEKEQDIQLVKRNADFSQDTLMERWRELIDFLKQKGKTNLAIALAANEPNLLTDFVITLDLNNAAQKEIFLQEKHMILEYLGDKLENDNIEIRTQIVENKKTVMPYTNQDKLKQMLNKNPQLEILRKKLALDPDY